MSRDSSHTYIHLHAPHHADHLEDFSRNALEKQPFEIAVDPAHEPLNPEDEDDVVPNEHAAFGIQRATQRAKKPAWRDLGLERILDAGPPPAVKKGGAGAGKGSAVGPRTIR